MTKKITQTSYTKQAGFSLIELVISIIILSLISLVITNFMGNSIQGLVKSKDNINLMSKLRYIDQRLAKELRRIDFNSTSGLYELIVAPTNTKIEYTDVTGANDVVISYNGSDTLNISYSNPASTGDLSREMSAFDFNYYNANGLPAAADGSDLVFVEYSFTLTDDGASYSHRSRVMLRDQK